MHIGLIHETNFGPIEIIQYITARSVVVKFLSTGLQREAKACHIREGLVKDSSAIPSDISIGSIHETKNNGKVEVVCKTKKSTVLVRFLETGYEKECRFDDVRTGSIRDRLAKTVYGIGVIGVGIHKPMIGPDHNPAYKSWSRMLERCYSVRWQKAKPTYIGCTVCEDWLNYQIFSEWYYSNYPKDGKEYQLDKDIKVDGNKIYSPETCMFVTPEENSIKAHARNATVKNPEGVTVSIYNVARFCRENNLKQTELGKVINGKSASYKGWTCSGV